MIEEIVSKKLKELTEKGEIDKIVEENLKKAINGIIENSVRSYSEVGKALEKSITESILGEMDKLKFSQFSVAINEVLQAKLNESFMEIAIKPIQETIDKFMDVIEKKEWTLSEVINKFMEMEVKDDDSHNESGEITVHIKESSYGTVWIAFDEDRSTDEYRCKYRLAIEEKTGRLWHFSVDQKKISPFTTSSFHGFDLFLFKLYASNCIIKLDEDNVEKTWSTYD